MLLAAVSACAADQGVSSIAAQPLPSVAVETTLPSTDGLGSTGSTEPPATEPPATEPPSTEAPATQPPTTEQPSWWCVFRPNEPSMKVLGPAE